MLNSPSICSYLPLLLSSSVSSVVYGQFILVVHPDGSHQWNLVLVLSAGNTLHNSERYDYRNAVKEYNFILKCRVTSKMPVVGVVAE